MIGYWGSRNMMNWGEPGLFGGLGFIFCLVIFIDLVLLGIWLWKQINKK